MNPVPSMTVDVWQDGPIRYAANSVLSKAVIVSLLLHTVVFVVLVSVSLSPVVRQQSDTQDRVQSIAITLVNPVVDAEVAPDSTAQNTLPEPGELQEDSVATVATQDITSVESQNRKPAISSQNEVSPESDVAPETTDSEQNLVNPPQTREEVIALVNSSIASFKVENRQSLNQQYVESCLRYRNRYGANRDCPQSFSTESESEHQEKALVGELFANVTRDADHARMSRKIEREITLLEGIMEEGGVAGEQAEIRWRLNRQYHAYLNGNIIPELTWRSQTAMVNDYGRTVTPGPYQFRCKELPCVYKYTGFEVKRPVNYVEKESSFVVLPPLFRGSNN